MKIREDGVGGVFVDGLSEHVVRNTDGIMSLLRTGARLRTTGSTKMNEVQMNSAKFCKTMGWFLYTDFNKKM